MSKTQKANLTEGGRKVDRSTRTVRQTVNLTEGGRRVARSTRRVRQAVNLAEGGRRVDRSTRRVRQTVNLPERVEWFRQLGFGMFIHWSLDSQLGCVISHSMPGASEDYLHRFIHDLPKTFYPERFNPRAWARLAKVAGVKYVMFTTKHHSGFCMFHTRTTDFGIMHTPFRRDIVAEVVTAFREQEIAIGLYFSCDDFAFLRKQGRVIDRQDQNMPFRNPELMAFAKAQLTELLTHYGAVDLMFFDGKSQGLVEHVWSLQPQVVITSGALRVTEQFIPGVPDDKPFEACFTMGTEWPYRPADLYKSGLTIIKMLLETRAKGGNLLLNIGPRADGEVSVEQEDRLRQVGFWNFINHEAMEGVRPWIITNEGDTWFTRLPGTKQAGDTVYAIVCSPWSYGTWRDLHLVSVQATAKTQVTVLGQNDLVLEYRAEVKPATTFTQKAGGLHIRAMRAQRTFTNNIDPNPVVLKITHARPGLRPSDLPVVTTSGSAWDAGRRTATLTGKVESMGAGKSLEVGFEYRDIKGMDTHERTNPWRQLPLQTIRTKGAFSSDLPSLTAGEQYEFRAIARHPLLDRFGLEKRLTIP